MESSRFDLIFDGRILPDADPAQVRARLAALFKTDEASIGKLFSGKRYVLKKGLDEASARKYQAALNRAGAQCELVARQAAMTIAPPGVILVETAPPAAPEFDVSAFSLAEAGADVLDDYASPEPPQLDVDGIALAPVGVDLQEARPAPSPPPQAPDLSVAAVGALMDEGSALARAAEIPETSHLALAPVDATPDGEDAQ
ncbi:MAG TPA: hypothetical protein ENK48_05505 [Gammaproteobacteria bacterium]|nr:hypothetical protein [Gammaproteobacteria bacterium]